MFLDTSRSSILRSCQGQRTPAMPALVGSLDGKSLSRGAPGWSPKDGRSPQWEDQKEWCLQYCWRCTQWKPGGGSEFAGSEMVENAGNHHSLALSAMTRSRAFRHGTPSGIPGPATLQFFPWGKPLDPLKDGVTCGSGPWDIAMLLLDTYMSSGVRHPGRSN